jgi:hypothetical protein
MTIMSPTEYLELAACGWLQQVLQKVPKGGEIIDSALADAFDLRIVVEFRSGKLRLEAFTKDERCELYCEDVQPLRPADGFGATSSAVQ